MHPQLNCILLRSGVSECDVRGASFICTFVCTVMGASWRSFPSGRLRFILQEELGRRGKYEQYKDVIESFTRKEEFSDFASKHLSQEQCDKWYAMQSLSGESGRKRHCGPSRAPTLHTETQPDTYVDVAAKTQMNMQSTTQKNLNCKELTSNPVDVRIDTTRPRTAPDTGVSEAPQHSPNRTATTQPTPTNVTPTDLNTLAEYSDDAQTASRQARAEFLRRPRRQSFGVNVKAFAEHEEINPEDCQSVGRPPCHSPAGLRDAEAKFHQSLNLVRRSISGMTNSEASSQAPTVLTPAASVAHPTATRRSCVSNSRTTPLHGVENMSARRHHIEQELANITPCQGLEATPLLFLTRPPGSQRQPKELSADNQTLDRASSQQPLPSASFQQVLRGGLGGYRSSPVMQRPRTTESTATDTDRANSGFLKSERQRMPASQVDQRPSGGLLDPRVVHPSDHDRQGRPASRTVSRSSLTPFPCSQENRAPTQSVICARSPLRPSSPSLRRSPPPARQSPPQVRRRSVSFLGFDGSHIPAGASGKRTSDNAKKSVVIPRLRVPPRESCLLMDRVKTRIRVRIEEIRDFLISRMQAFCRKFQYLLTGLLLLSVIATWIYHSFGHSDAVWRSAPALSSSSRRLTFCDSRSASAIDCIQCPTGATCENGGYQCPDFTSLSVTGSVSRSLSKMRSSNYKCTNHKHILFEIVSLGLKSIADHLKRLENSLPCTTRVTSDLPVASNDKYLDLTTLFDIHITPIQIEAQNFFDGRGLHQLKLRQELFSVTNAMLSQQTFLNDLNLHRHPTKPFALASIASLHRNNCRLQRRISRFFQQEHTSAGTILAFCVLVASCYAVKHFNLAHALTTSPFFFRQTSVDRSKPQKVQRSSTHTKQDHHLKRNPTPRRFKI